MFVKRKNKTGDILFYAAIIGLVIARYFYGSCIAASYSSNEGVDATLQFIKALSYWQGEWMGPYDENALIKGCFYPIFAGTIFKLSLNYVQTIQIFYILSCLFTVCCFSPMIKKRWVRLIVLALLLINPMSTSSESSTTYRSTIYYITALIFLSGICGWALRIAEGRGTLCLVTGALFYGISLNTREDSQWLTLFLAVAAIVYIFFYLKYYNRGFKKLLAMIVIMAVMCGLPSLLIASKNREVYGVFLTEDYNSGEFARACGALSRPYSSREDVAHYPVPEDVRLKLYEISPSFKELQPYLEGDGSATRWKAFGDGTDYHNGWITYALRTAALSAGYYKDAQSTEEFWKRVADEVNEACDKGIIDARKGHLKGIAAPFSKDYVAPVAQNTAKAMWYAARCEFVTPLLDYIESDKELVDRIEGILHSHINASYRNEYGLLKANIDLNSNGYKLIVSVNRIYQIAMTVLFPLSLLVSVYLFINAFRKKKVDYTVKVIILFAVFFLLLARATMLAYVDVTAYSTIVRPLYMNNCYVICELFVLLAFAFLASEGRKRDR